VVFFSVEVPVIRISGAGLLVQIFLKSGSSVKARTQYNQILPGFRVKPGMTAKKVIQRSHIVTIKI
jgi:hypothetical protein